MTKFKLTSETIIAPNKARLFRIELTADCKHGKAGDKGGFLEKETNLQGNAWVSGDAWVSGNAHVYGNARVYGNAWVSGDAHVYGNAHVYGDARVYGDAHVYGDARVYGEARVYGDAHVYGNAWVSGDAHVYGNAWGKSPLQIQGSRHFVNICKKGFLQIGCKSYSLETWLESFTTIGKQNGYSENEIAEYKHYIDLAIKLSKL